MENMQTGTPGELEKTLSELRDYEKKNLRINRIKLICAAAALAVCVVIAAVLIGNVKKITNEVENTAAVMNKAGESINDVAESLSEIDFEALSTSVQTFTGIGTETIEQIKTSTEGLDTLIEDAHTAIGNLSSVNIDDLNSGIKRLNEVLEPLANFFNIFH